MKGLAKLAPGPGNVALADRPAPVIRPGHVIVDVVGAGICGTDLHIVDDEFPTEPPVTMGHELSGVVAELGDGVEQRWLGARVVAETYFSTCGTCRSCRAGRINLCPERRSIGSRADGAFAAGILLPVRNLHRVPDWLDAHAAALAEPLACVCHALLEPAVVAPGDRVLVTGPGPVGLLAAQVARAAGGEVHVVGTPRDGLRLAKARALGCSTGVAGATLPFDAADVAIECSGSGAGMAACLHAAARRAHYVQIGLAGKPVSVPLDEVPLRELTVTGGNASTPSSWRRALDLVESRAVDLPTLVTAVVSLAEWERAFAATRAGDGIKYILDPRE